MHGEFVRQQTWRAALQAELLAKKAIDFVPSQINSSFISVRGEQILEL